MLSAYPVLGILFVGLVVVVGSILLLRLHAFLALVIAAILVSVLTPSSSVQYYVLQQKQLDVESTSEDSITLDNGSSKSLSAGTPLLHVRPNPDSGHLEIANRLTVFNIDADQNAVLKPDGDKNLTYGKNSLVVHPTSWQDAVSQSKKTVGERVADSFGKTCTGIAILIALAAIIGKCLLDSGAADRIVRSTLNLFGERNAPLSFTLSGFALSTPVFFDTVFYLMIPIGKAMRLRTGRNYLLYVLTIVTGGTMAHSLVPPTPGPLFVADELGVDLGMMIVAGGIVGLVCAAFGYFYAHWANRMWELPLRETPDMSLDDLQQIADKSDSELPPFWMAILPIVLPVLLISGYTFLNSASKSYTINEDLLYLAKTFGNKNIAMTISAIIAIVMLVMQKRSQLSELSESIQAALSSGGVIILITAAGGAFGKALQQTGISNLIQDLNLTSPVLVVTAAFLITALIRAAQGSATVSMITAVGIMAPFADPNVSGMHPVYLAVAIGCGSKPFLWMNDSGFWVIGKMSGMTEYETLKYVMPMTTAMGFVGLLATIIGVLLFPMVPT